MNERLIAVLKDAVECRCRPSLDDIDAQNILFIQDEVICLRGVVQDQQKIIERKGFELLQALGKIDKLTAERDAALREAKEALESCKWYEPTGESYFAAAKVDKAIATINEVLK